MRKTFSLVFTGAFLLRLLSLNQSLWLDEAITAKVVRSIPLFEIVSRFSPGDFHPPLYYIFMKMWSFLFGTSEIAMRMPSVIFSVLTGHAVFLIGSRIKNERFGLLAAAIYLFNPLSVYYAQEARMYALSTMLLAFSLYFLLNIVAEHKPEHRGMASRMKGFLSQMKRLFVKPAKEDTPSLLLRLRSERLSLIAMNVLFILAAWTFYGSYFFIAACLLLLLLRKKYKQFGITVAVLLISFVIQLPLLLQQLHTAQTAMTQVPFWGGVLGSATVKNLLLIFVKFSFGRISFFPKAPYYLLAGLWTLFVFSFVILGSLIDRRLAIIFAVPILLGLIVSFFAPMLQYFRFQFLLPVMSLLIMLGIENYVIGKKKKGLFAFFKREKSKRFIDHLKENAVVEVLIGMFLFLSLLTLLVPQYRREDWKSLTKSIPQGQSVYMIISSADAFTYYAPRSKVHDLRNLENDWFYERQVYVIPYTADIYGLKYEETLHNMGCFPGQKVDFNGGIYYEVWDCGKVG